jgi:hypothetical protein
MEDAKNNMSVKRLKFQKELNEALSQRLRELFRTFDHLTREAFRDILTNHDYSLRVGNELLERAKYFQKRDMEKAKETL